MKFTTHFNMDNCLTCEGVELLSTGLLLYQRERNSFADDLFDVVSEKAYRYDNRKLLEQSKITKERCNESERMIDIQRIAVASALQLDFHSAKGNQLSRDQNISTAAALQNSEVTIGMPDKMSTDQVGCSCNCKTISMACLHETVPSSEEYPSSARDISPATSSISGRRTQLTAGLGEHLVLTEEYKLDITGKDWFFENRPLTSTVTSVSSIANGGFKLVVPDSPLHISDTDTAVSKKADTHSLTHLDPIDPKESCINKYGDLNSCVHRICEVTLPESSNSRSTPPDSTRYICGRVDEPSSVKLDEAADSPDSGCPSSRSSLCRRKRDALSCKIIEQEDSYLPVDHEVLIPSDTSWPSESGMRVESDDTLEYKIQHHEKIQGSLDQQMSRDEDDPGIEFTVSPQTSSTPSKSHEDYSFIPHREPDRNPLSIDCSISKDLHTESHPGSRVETSSHCRLSPVLSTKQKQAAMQKRRSFHGFTSSVSFPFLAFNKSKRTAEENIKRLSADSSISVSEYDENDPEVQVTDAADSSSLKRSSQSSKEHSEMTRNLRSERCASLYKASSESLPSLPEEGDFDAVARIRSGDGLLHKGWSPVPVNSHLISLRVLPSTRYASMADLRLTEAELRSRLTLTRTIDELIHTERDYVTALQLVVNRYIPEVTRPDAPDSIRGKIGDIFGNIEHIYDFHSTCFLQELIGCENEPFKISECFLRHEEDFLMYALYNKNKPKSDALMGEHGNSFFRTQQLMMQDKMDLSSYLLKPVQRMGKYALIVKQILKECAETRPEHAELLRAEEMIRFCLQHGNDLLALEALKASNLDPQAHGRLLLQDEFSIQKGKRKSLRHIFLFDHLIVFSKTTRIGAGRDEYMFKSCIKTVDIGLTENVGTSGLKFEIWFRKRSRGNWIFHASSHQQKNKWVSTIQKLLWEQALKSRESRLAELLAKGVGNKPNKDIKHPIAPHRDSVLQTSKASMRRSVTLPGMWPSPEVILSPPNSSVTPSTLLIPLHNQDHKGLLENAHTMLTLKAKSDIGRRDSGVSSLLELSPQGASPQECVTGHDISKINS